MPSFMNAIDTAKFQEFVDEIGYKLLKKAGLDLPLDTLEDCLTEVMTANQAAMVAWKDTYKKNQKLGDNK